MSASKCGSALALLALSAPWAASGARLARDKSEKTKDCYSRYDGKALLHLTPCTEMEAADMSTLLEEQDCVLLSDALMAHPSGGCGEAAAACAANAAAAVEKKFGKHASIASTDAGAFYREASGTAVPYVEVEAMGASLSSDFYSDWRDLDARYGRVEAAVAGSSGIAKMSVVGESFEGRPIKAVRFTGAGYSPGNPKVLLTFNLHAREWIAGMAGVYAVEKLAEMVKKDPSVIAGMEVVMVPMANPDGFVETLGINRFHRKNMNNEVGLLCSGVDLNRNFGYKWASGGASGFVCSDTFYGPGPNSEPETKAVVSLMDEAPMTVYIDVHSYSQLILSSWGWTKDDHPRKAEFAELGGLMKAAMEGADGKTYKEGPTAQLLYAASGTSTDTATDKGALGYCYELRPGTNVGLFGFAPPKSEILPGVEECFAGIVAAIEYARTK